ncbi:retrovirus-related pol polyprotein from transposon TNT 1-94 [Tanacetum coccineum]
MIKVCLNATVCNIRTDNGTEFANQTLRAYYEEVEISHQTLVARSSQQNDIVERRNHALVEATRTIKPDLSYLHVFGALCYPTNDSEDLDFDEVKATTFEQFSLGPRPKLLTPKTISSGLMPNVPSSTLYVPPMKND